MVNKSAWARPKRRVGAPARRRPVPSGGPAGDGLDPGGLEGHAGPVVHGPGGGDEGGDADGGELAEALGLAGDLDGDEVAAAAAQGEEVDVEERAAFLVGLGRLGVELEGGLGRSGGDKVDGGGVAGQARDGLL